MISGGGDKRMYTLPNTADIEIQILACEFKRIQTLELQSVTC
jgi:hypothetical protein